MAVLCVTKDNFEKEILNSSQPVLVDFYAIWCGPCRIISPVIEQIANEMPGYKVCKINIDKEPELAKKYQVTGVPTLKTFKNGIPIQTLVGIRPKEAIIRIMTAT